MSSQEFAKHKLVADVARAIQLIIENLPIDLPKSIRKETTSFETKMVYTIGKSGILGGVTTLEVIFEFEDKGTWTAAFKKLSITPNKKTIANPNFEKSKEQILRVLTEKNFPWINENAIVFNG